MSEAHSNTKKRLRPNVHWNTEKDEKCHKKNSNDEASTLNIIELDKCYKNSKDGITKDDSLFLILPFELKRICFSFLKDDEYILIAPVSKMFRDLYHDRFKSTKTSCAAAIGSFSCARYCIIQARDFSNVSRSSDTCDDDNDDSYSDPIDWKSQIMRRAVSKGIHEILYLADEFGLHLNDILDNEHQMELGKHGTIEIFQYLKRKNVNISGYVGQGAAKEGRLNILKWMKDEGYQMEVDDSYGTLCYQAAKGGHLEVLQWAIKEGYEFFRERMAGYHAVVGGHLDVLKWMKSNGYGIEMDKMYGSLCYQAAKNGHLHVLKWGLSEGFTLNKRICAEAAAFSGNVEVLEFCKTEGCLFGESTVFNAVTTGNLDIVKYCFENDCPRHENLCMAAAKSGNIECLKLVRSYGVPWGLKTCYTAARDGNLSILKYAHENGCPWDPKTYAVAKNRFIFRSKGDDVLRFLEENNCPS